MSDERLRVAYLVRYLPSASETFVLDEALALEAAGASVRVWTLGREPGSVAHARHEALHAAAAHVARPSSPRAIFDTLVLGESVEFAGVRATWQPHGRAKDLRRVAWLARRWRRAAVQVVRVHHAGETARFALAAAGLAGIPVSVAVHGRDLFVPVGDFESLLRRAGNVTTITPFHRDLLLRAGLLSQSVHLLPCAVGLPAEMAPAPSVGSALKILSVGRLVSKKGHDLLVRACASLAGEGTPIELKILGEGRERNALEKLIAEMVEQVGADLRIELLGARPVEEVEALLGSGHFHLAALVCRVAGDGDRDGVPVSLLEAQAHGVPVVTSALPGFDYELEDGEGTVLLPVSASPDGRVEPELSDLVRAIAELYRDLDYRSRMAASARSRAERRMPPEAVGKECLRLLESLCSNIRSL